MNYIDSQGNDWTPVFAKFDNPGPHKIFEIGYVDYRDELPDDYISAELSGSWAEMDDWHERNWDHFADHEYDGARGWAEWVLENHGIDHDEAYLEDLFDELISAIQDSPAAKSALEQMRDNAPDKLMRIELMDAGALQDGFDDAYHDYDAKHKALTQRFRELGLDVNSKVNQTALFDIIYNGCEYWHDGVSLDIIWYGDYRDVVPGQTEKQVTFTNPHLVLIDSWNGSGFDAEIEGTLTVTIDPASQDGARQRAYLDSDAPGYGWDDVAGVVHSAYDTKVTIATPEQAA